MQGGAFGGRNTSTSSLREFVRLDNSPQKSSFSEPGIGISSLKVEASNLKMVAVNLSHPYNYIGLAHTMQFTAAIEFQCLL